MACTFQVTIGGTFASLIGLRMRTWASIPWLPPIIQQWQMKPVGYLERNVAEKKPWVTRDILDLCDERRDLKKRYEAEGAKKYKKANKRIQNAVKKAKEDYLGA